MYISHSNRSSTTADRHRAGKAAIVALLSVSALLHAQDRGGSVIDELLETMRESTSVQARKVTELPSDLQGKLIAIAEFDDEEQRWQPMDSPQEFGMATNDRISALGYDLGQVRIGLRQIRYLLLRPIPNTQ